jgi:translation initiation factor 4A
MEISNIDDIKESSELHEVLTFEELCLSDEVLKGIYAHGWDKPSAIQRKAILPILKGNDIIAQAQSGTGKTGTFSISALSIIDTKINAPQVLMLSPVKDLAMQTYKIVKALGQYTGVKVSLLVGKGLGKSEIDYSDRDDIPPPDFKSHIFVGTPGKVGEWLRRKKLNLNSLRLMILDEADEMLSKGFKDQIKEIFGYISTEAQIGLFSATIPRDILDITRNFMKNPVRILVKEEELTLEGIRQFYVSLENEEQKFVVLSDIYESVSVSQGIIFVNSKQKSEELKDRLEKKNYTVGLIHGGYNQYERNDILSDFKIGKTRILIATDILARGIDIQQISLVINYDIPYKVEPYIHRIGRSGRFGKKGIAINLITMDDAQNMKKIERHYNTIVEPLPMNFMELA